MFQRQGSWTDFDEFWYERYATDQREFVEKKTETNKNK
jgi:hypothetical protein